MTERNTLVVDTAVLAENYRVLCGYIRNKGVPVWCDGRILRPCAPRAARAIAVVKADGYGHGATTVARTLSAVGCDAFAVATADEAAGLRAALPGAAILLLDPVPREDLDELGELGITVTAGDARGLRDAAQVARKRDARGARPLAVHLAADTGMGRYGFPCRTERDARRTCDAILAAVRGAPGLTVTGVYTHMARADEGTEDAKIVTRGQCSAFFALVNGLRAGGLSVIAHAGASAASLALGTMGLDAFRLGIALYGYPPGDAFPAPLAGAIACPMTLRARVDAVRRPKKGDAIGYGGDYRAAGDERIACVALGYADGLPRAAVGGTLTLRGRAFPIVGRVCMDACFLAVRDTRVVPNDEVTVFDATGAGLMGLARAAGTTPYELLVNAGRRARKTVTENRTAVRDRG